MRRFHEILFFFPDPKPNSKPLRRAARLARLNKARLTVINVLEPPPDDLPVYQVLTPAQMREQAAMEAQERMERAIAAFQHTGLNIATKLFFGIPFLEIIHEVQRHGYDLVILSAEGKPKGLWFGSTATHLIRKCPCPVWVLKPRSPRKYRQVMVAIDPGSSDPTKRSLSQKLVELASSLARIEGSVLHVVHAWDAYGERLMRTQAGLSPVEAQQYVSRVRKSHEQLVQDVLGRIDLTGVNYRVHLLRGNPGSVISQLAEKLHVEVLVMGTLSRTGIAGFIIGNTAEKVLQKVNCALLAVKPNGFVSPVRLDG